MEGSRSRGAHLCRVYDRNWMVAGGGGRGKRRMSKTGMCLKAEGKDGGLKTRRDLYGGQKGY